MTYITEKSRAELMSYINEDAIVTGKLECISSRHCSILITDVYIQLLSDNSILEYDHIWLGLRDLKQVHVLDRGKVVSYGGTVRAYHRDYGKDNIAWSVGDAVNLDTCRPKITPMGASLRWKLLRATLVLHHVFAIILSLMYKARNSLCTHEEICNAAAASNTKLEKSYIKQAKRSISYNKKLLKEIFSLYDLIMYEMRNNKDFLYNHKYVEDLIKSYPYLSNRAFKRFQQESEQCELAEAFDQLQAMYSNH